MKRIIVSRHEGAIIWMAWKMFPYHKEGFALHREVRGGKEEIVGVAPLFPPQEYGWEPETGTEIPVKASVTEADLTEEVEVWGNLPLDLAAKAGAVVAVLFPPGKAPRGQDYTAEQMEEAGAFTRRFGVLSLEYADGGNLRKYLESGGFTS